MESQYTRTKAGWARPEWLVIIGTTLIVFSIIVPSLWAYRTHRVYRMVQRDMVAVLDASRRFFEDNNHWPTQYTGEYGDYRYGWDLSNAEIINVLRAKDGPGNEEHSTNPRQEVYLEVLAYRARRSGLNANGEFLDPWGTPYQFVVDTDLNNTCYIERSIHGQQVGTGMVMWSCGPDQKSDSYDDILSWKM